VDAPLNEKIERTLKRKAARKKNDSNYMPVLSLHEQVLALVKDVNSKLPQERHVTPRSALTVMNRSLASLSSLDYEARSFAVLKEVSRFLNVATKTFTSSQTDNIDLLVAGHPLSTLNASISVEEFLKKNAQWIAADPSIHESIRPLVASAHSAAPGSIEREHAFARLNASKTLLASYFKIDNLSAIVAAFSSGNSSAAKRARVALQWRDRLGRWVEMGRGVNFRFRMPDGSIVTGRGTYIGAGGESKIERSGTGSSLTTDTGLIHVQGVPQIPSGLYTINSNNAVVYQARIPGMKAPEQGTFEGQFDKDIPSLEQVKAGRRETPIGWTWQRSFWASDDNYAVIPGRDGSPKFLKRIDANGGLGGLTIGEPRSWEEVNKMIEKDQPEFEKEIARIQAEEKEGQLPIGRIPGAKESDVVDPADLIEMQRQRAEENRARDEAAPQPQELPANRDLFGKPVPEGWTRDPNDASDTNYIREMPQRDGGTYQILAQQNPDGTYKAGSRYGWTPEPGTDGRGPLRRFESLEDVNKNGVPGIVEYLNRTFAEDNPIIVDDAPDEPPTPPSGGTPPKTPSPNVPSAPPLFQNFDVPEGAFKLRTVDYEPEGRVDEKSTDYDDNPKIIATRYTPQELVRGMSQALLGNSDDSAVADILNANVDDNDDVVDPADLPDSVDIASVRMGVPSGAGQLEFNAGAEFVPAEALYNALYLAGLDPNRVIANIYDSANGNNNNLNRLIEAQGGVPSAEEAQLVDDIVQEIRQLKEVSEPGDSPVANKKQASSPEPLPGSLIENIAIDFENPDYYIPNPQAYIPSQPDLDENGYTDNPEIIAGDYEVADLIEQFIAGITDGSGVVLLAFDNITVEVPIEAIRDALQLKGINTNQLLLDLKKESNDMSEDLTSLLPEQISNQKIKDKNGAEFELNLVKIGNVYEGALINKGNNNRIQIVVRDEDLQEAKRTLREAGRYIKQAANGDEAMDDGFIPNLDRVEQPQASETRTLQGHSQMIQDLVEQAGGSVDDDTADKIRDAIDQEGLVDWSEADDAEIIDAITEVAGAGIFGQASETPSAGASGKEIYERRMATGDSLEKVARDLGITREEVRRLESAYARTLNEDPARVGPPTTGERQAPETPEQDFAPFANNAVLNDLAGEVARAFSNGFGPENKVVGVYEEDDNGRAMIAVATEYTDENRVIIFLSSRDGITSSYSGVSPAWFDGPGANIGWRQLSPEESSAMSERIGSYTPDAPAVQPEPPADSADTPRDPSVDTPALATPTLQYPGPENRGYNVDNTVLDITGKVMGNGTRIRASRDGRTGTVIAVQNIDSRTGERIPYVRVRFDDGTIAVRSALKVRAIGDAQQIAPNEAQRQAPTPPPIPDVSERLNALALNPGAIATEGNIQGVNDLGTTPDRLKEFVNPDAKQSDFSVWGLRAGEIARAGRDRVKLESIKQAAIDYQLAVLANREPISQEEKERLSLEVTKKKEILDAMMKDTYGVRDSVTFGSNKYSLSFGGFSIFLGGTKEELESGNQPMSLSVSMNVLDANGRTIGSVSRTISGKQVTNPSTEDKNYEWMVKNNYLGINNAKDKKSGFATAYNRFMEDWYIANGVKEIHVQAAAGGGYQGGFVWALNGFNWETPTRAEGEVFSRLRAMRRSATKDGEIAQIDRLIEKANAAKLTDGGLDLNKTPTPMELALVGWYPGAKTWAGKELMSRNGWMGVKRLDPTAKEQIQSINYDQIRAARKRVEAKENKPNVSREFALKANSNEFETNNPALQPYMAEIRDVLQNNRSLAVLSPAAKNALSLYVSEQILQGEGRELPLNDVFQLRTALDAEEYADNPRMTARNFGVGDELAAADYQAIVNNQVPGFSSRVLGHDESGYNETYLVTHTDSGQVFYVKQDQLSQDYGIDAPQAEAEAGILIRALNMQGAYETRTVTSTNGALVMQQAGSSMNLGSAPEVAAKVYRRGGITRNDGSRLLFKEESLASNLYAPEDVVRMALLDLIINNEDRHNGNVLLAVDGRDPTRIRVLPIDHALAQLKPSRLDDFRIEDIMSVRGDSVYAATMPVLTQKLKEDELLAIFQNEANRMREALKGDSILPTGKELDMLIDRWGSVDNYRAAINSRLDALLKPDGSNHGEFKNVLKNRYWD